MLYPGAKAVAIRCSSTQVENIRENSMNLELNEMLMVIVSDWRLLN